MAWLRKDAGSFDAQDLARGAVLADAGDSKLVGDYLSVDFDTDGRMASYLF